VLPLAVLQWASAPEVLEPIPRQLGVAHRVLDVLVPQIGLMRIAGPTVGTLHASISFTAVAANGLPVAVVWPRLASSAAIVRNDRRPPFGDVL
jgi:hypothetical protein